MAAQRAVHHRDRGKWPAVRIDAVKNGVGDAGRGGEPAIEKYRAKIAGRGAHLADISIAAQRADFTILENRRPGTPDEIDITLDHVIAEIGGVRSVDLERILIAPEIALLDDGPKTTYDQRLRLGASVRGGISNGEAVENRVVASDVEYGAGGG